MKYLNKFSFKKGNQNRYVLFLVESIRELNNEEKEKIIAILNPNISEELKTEEVKFVQGMDIKYIGPNLRVETPESSKLRAICESFHLDGVLRIEKFEQYYCNPGNEPKYDLMTESVYSDLPLTLVNQSVKEATKVLPLMAGGLGYFFNLNDQMGLGMDEFDREYYFDLFMRNYKRNPTDVELMQLAQANSSHSRHWEFSGKFIIDGNVMPKTLFEMVKDTLKQNPKGSVKSFKDNGSILAGGFANILLYDQEGVYKSSVMKMNLTATAETHNHPTLISPYPGAATGVGGRMRDISAIGRGSLISFGGVYFQTGRLWINHDYPPIPYPANMAIPKELLKGAILGASGWGNPFGEPTLLFGNDSLGFVLPNNEKFESVKPIIYTCAVGSIPAGAKDKSEARPELMIVRIGGPTWRIGVGGGAASSMGAGENKSELDFKSVQRGEPMMGRSAYNVIEECVFMGKNNPIESIHDQGAGGASNVLTELTEPCGGIIDLAKMKIADDSLSQAEAWVAESQEIYGLLIKPENVELLTRICEKHNCPIEIVGKTNDSQKIMVIDSRDNSTPVDLTLPEILGKLPQKTYTDETVVYNLGNPLLANISVKVLLQRVAKIPGVTLIDYMVDRFDGSVGGRVIQGPRCGVNQLPVCCYGLISNGFKGVTGSLGSFVRSNPAAMLGDEKANSRMLVAQALMNLSLVVVPGGTSKIKNRLNVMWPFKKAGMKARLYSAYTEVTNTLKEVGFGVDGGKDSLSMTVKFENMEVSSFPTFTIESYAHVADFRKRVTPDLKNEDSVLLLITTGKLNGSLGATALAESFDIVGSNTPDVDVKKAKNIFNLMQSLIRKDKIMSASPIQKGGLLSTLAKMKLTSLAGCYVDNPTDLPDENFYFNEEIGMIIQCKEKDVKFIKGRVNNYGLNLEEIGTVKPNKLYFEFTEKISKFGSGRYSEHVSDLYSWFSCTSKEIKILTEVNKDSVNSELCSGMTQNYNLTFNPDEKREINKDKKFKVAVLTAPGTNGHHELANMFMGIKKGFEVHKVEMKKLIDGEVDLKDFNVLAFAGGFSYGDVGESGKGWAASILFNPKLKKMFDDFFKRPDTMSFGVCNGFQVGALLGIFDETFYKKPRLLHNKSGVFEHRPVNLLIPEDTRAIMFKGMEGSVLPAWSAHGEGRLEFNYRFDEYKQFVAVYYTDKEGNPTESYPANPNGSKYGVAGLTTKDGRHTFMMPHIERVSASNHHLPYRPDGFNFKTPVWQRAIHNMYEWLCEMDSIKSQSGRV